MADKIKKNPFTRDSAIMTSDTVNISHIREIAQAADKSGSLEDGQKFVDAIVGLIQEKKLTLDNMPEFADLRYIIENFRDAKIKHNIYDPVKCQMREVISSAFALIGGNIAIAKISEAYDEIDRISDEITTPLEDNATISIIAAIHDKDNSVESLKEGDEYPLIGGEEESCEIRDNKNGRRVELFEEMFLNNQLGAVVSRLTNLGKIASRWEERITIKRVLDVCGSRTASASAPYVYNPRVSGQATGQALYLKTARARIPANRIENNALQSIDNIELAFKALGKATDNDGKTPIAINLANIRLLCPWALGFTALKLTDSELVPGVENARNPYGPGAKFSLTGKVITSNYLDYHDATTWYLGDFKSQFVKKIARRIVVDSLGGITESYIKKGVALQVRAAWNINVGASDYVFVTQNLEGVTYLPTK